MPISTFPTGHFQNYESGISTPSLTFSDSGRMSVLSQVDHEVNQVLGTGEMLDPSWAETGLPANRNDFIRNCHEGAAIVYAEECMKMPAQSHVQLRPGAMPPDEQLQAHYILSWYQGAVPGAKEEIAQQATATWNRQAEASIRSKAMQSGFSAQPSGNNMVAPQAGASSMSNLLHRSLQNELIQEPNSTAQSLVSNSTPMETQEHVDWQNFLADGSISEGSTLPTSLDMMGSSIANTNYLEDMSADISDVPFGAYDDLGFNLTEGEITQMMQADPFLNMQVPPQNDDPLAGGQFINGTADLAFDTGMNEFMPVPTLTGHEPPSNLVPPMGPIQGETPFTAADAVFHEGNVGMDFGSAFPMESAFWNQQEQAYVEHTAPFVQPENRSSANSGSVTPQSASRLQRTVGEGSEFLKSFQALNEEKKTGTPEWPGIPLTRQRSFDRDLQATLAEGRRRKGKLVNFSEALVDRVNVSNANNKPEKIDPEAAKALYIRLTTPTEGGKRSLTKIGHKKINNQADPKQLSRFINWDKVHTLDQVASAVAASCRVGKQGYKSPFATNALKKGLEKINSAGTVYTLAQAQAMLATKGTSRK